MVERCQGCGDELPPQKHRGRRRKWCGRGRCGKPAPKLTVLPSDMLPGTAYGRLTVVEYVSSTVVRARCECGQATEVLAHSLRSGNTRSCGCLVRENKGSPSKHGWTNTPEYRCWQNIKRRIFNPGCAAYPDYGGRGLTMEPEWVESFEAFLAEVGPRPSPELSIDRIDNDLGYVKGNLRWATAEQQANNQRARRAA